MKCENPDLGAKPFDLVRATPAHLPNEALLQNLGAQEENITPAGLLNQLAF
jgi:hypothetical protein